MNEIEIFKLFGSVFIENEKANKSLDATAKKGEDVAKSLVAMVGTAAKVGIGIAAGIGVAAGAMFALVVKTSDAASAINDMSVRTGISTKNLQELKFASDQVGVNFETVTGAVSKLTKAMSGAEDGGKAMQEAFGELGVKTSDASGQMRKMDDIFPEVISKLAGMKNETERNALAMTFFGKGAMELVPLLAQGEGGIKALTDKAHELGLVMTDEAITANDSFGDTLDQVKASVGALGMGIGTSLLPVVQGLLDKFMEHLPVIREVSGNLLAMGAAVIEKVKPVVADLANFFQTELQPRFENIAYIVKDIYTTYFPSLGTSTTGLGSTLRDMVLTALNLVMDGLKWIRDNSTFVSVAVEVITKAFIAYQVALLAVAAAVNIYTIAQNIQKAAMVVYNAVMVVATAAQWGYLIAMESGSIALGIIAVAQWLFNAALTANPIGVVIVALAALGAGIYELVKHWDTVTGAIEKAWNWLTKWNDTPAEDKTVTTHYVSDGQQQVNEQSNIRTNNDGNDGRLDKQLGHNANGTDNWRGGLSWVGERGPELLNLPRGSQVIPNHKLGGGVTIINQGTIVGTNGMNEFADMMSARMAQKFGLATGGAW